MPEPTAAVGAAAAGCTTAAWYAAAATATVSTTTASFKPGMTNHYNSVSCPSCNVHVVQQLLLLWYNKMIW